MFKKKIIKKKTITLEAYQPFFTTVDGAMHEGQQRKFTIAERLMCSVPEHLMILVKEKGYITDSNGIMYPLANVISVEWKLTSSTTLEDDFDECTIFVSAKELLEHTKEQLEKELKTNAN